jgi:hypothetical protein
MRRLPWLLWLLTVCLIGFSFYLWSAEDSPFAAGFLASATIGAVVAVRQPRNAIGWILCLIALGGSAAIVSDVYAEEASARSLLGGQLAAWLSTWVWLPSFIIAAVFLLLLFPDGRLLSRRWRPVAWLTGVVLVLGAFDEATTRERLSFGYENPLALSSEVADALSFLGPLGIVLLLFSLAASVTALIVRFRRSRGELRQQLKWFVFATAFMPLGFGLAGIQAGFGGIHPLGDVGWLVGILAATLGIPLSAGIAILRYRLYDIDVVINRTLVYGSVTAVLAAAYLGLVLLFQLAFSPVTEGNGLAVALSTLAVAALFRPARNRVQALVDRRFYRRKYDAQRTLEGFASRLREEVDLDALRAELTGVVAETMHPAHVSLWLRESAR